MLICDKKPSRARAGIPISGPPRGPNKDSPPASGPRLGRPWRGAARPRPPGLRPWRAFAHRAPAASSPSRRGSGTGAPVAGVGNRLRLSMPDAQPPGGFRASGKFKRWAVRSAVGVRGRAPRWGDGGQPGPGGGRPGCSRRLCPPSTDWARLSTGDRVQGGAVVQNNLIGQTFLVLHNQPAQSRASIGFQENHCIKK